MQCLDVMTIFIERCFSLVLFISIPTQAMPTFDTTDIKDSSEIFEQTTVEQFVENNAVTAHNDTAASTMTMTTTMAVVPNTTAIHMPIVGKAGNARAYNYTTSAPSSSSSLSGGAIAGIVIGVLVLLCCLCLCGCCSGEKGHWENVKVWVKD